MGVQVRMPCILGCYWCSEPEPLITIWRVGSAMIAAGGLALLGWALFADRSRGRLRCPRCWYDLGGTPVAEDGTRTCPECGCCGLSEHRLHRTRRRWRIVPIALLVLLAADQFRRVTALREHGWVGLVPTTAIIPLAPIQSERWVRQTLGGQYDLEDDRWAWLDDLRYELMRRDGENESWRWQGSAWATLAAWRPLADDQGATRSLSTAGVWSDYPCFPDRAQRQAELVNVLVAVVAAESWLCNGGVSGEILCVGDRLLTINTPEAIEDCRQLLTELRHPDTVDAAHKLALSPRVKDDLWIRVVFDLRPFVPLCSDDTLTQEMVVWAVASNLVQRTSPNDWVLYGGDGIDIETFEGRLILLGRPDLVAAAAVNMRSSIDAAHAELYITPAEMSRPATP